MINYALLTKHIVTNSTRLITLTWWAHYIFKDNTFIQHPDNRLAFSPGRERTEVVSRHDSPARFYELLHSEDWDEQVTATSVIFCTFWREVKSNKGCSSGKFWYNSASSKPKIGILLYFFSESPSLSPLCLSFLQLRIFYCFLESFLSHFSQKHMLFLKFLGFCLFVCLFLPFSVYEEMSPFLEMSGLTKDQWKK